MTPSGKSLPIALLSALSLGSGTNVQGAENTQQISSNVVEVTRAEVEKACRENPEFIKQYIKDACEVSTNEGTSYGEIDNETLEGIIKLGFAVIAALLILIGRKKIASFTIQTARGAKKLLLRFKKTPLTREEPRMEGSGELNDPENDQKVTTISQTTPLPKPSSIPLHPTASFEAPKKESKRLSNEELEGLIESLRVITSSPTEGMSREMVKGNLQSLKDACDEYLLRSDRSKEKVGEIEKILQEVIKLLEKISETEAEEARKQAEKVVAIFPPLETLPEHAREVTPEVTEAPKSELVAEPPAPTDAPEEQREQLPALATEITPKSTEAPATEASTEQSTVEEQREQLPPPPEVVYIDPILLERDIPDDTTQNQESSARESRGADANTERISAYLGTLTSSETYEYIRDQIFNGAEGIGNSSDVLGVAIARLQTIMNDSNTGINERITIKSLLNELQTKQNELLNPPKVKKSLWSSFLGLFRKG